MRPVKLTIALLLAFQSGRILNSDSALRSTFIFGMGPVFSSPAPARLANNYRDYLEHCRQEDLSALFQTAQEMARETQLNRTADYKHVSHIANKIRKLASRIRSRLTLGNQTADEKSLRGVTSESASSEFLQNQVADLSQLIRRIRSSSAARTKHVIDARIQCELYGELEALETLALQVKFQAEELMRHGE